MIAGDETVTTAIEIKGPLFYLGRIAETARKDHVDSQRATLEEAFEEVMEQTVTVLFDFEEE